MSSSAHTAASAAATTSGGSLASATGTLSAAALFDVRGWVCVGGATGLGLVTAAALAENGATVIICGRRAEALEDAQKRLAGLQGKVVTVVADVATKEGIVKLREATAAVSPFVNLLVNNHGICQSHADPNAVPQTPEALSKEMFENESFEHWLDTFRINTASYYFTAWAFLPLLAAAREHGFSEPGNLVNIASMSGVTKTSQRGQMNYNAGKAATISLSDQLACEFVRRDLAVRVNVINPGYFPSQMTVITPDDNTGSAAQQNTFRTQWGIPLARPGSAADYAQCILSVATNKYQTGSHIDIDGGWLLEQRF